MAISPRKLAANQENARRSTGPRTPEGKARVRYNALKHGLLAKEVIVPVGDEQEKRAEFELFLDDLWQHYAPVGPIEAMLVDKIAVAYWRLRRATRAEVGELSLEFSKANGSGVVVLFSRVVEKVQKQVEEADPNVDFATWLQTDENMATLGWDVKYAAEYIKGVDPAERKPWLLQALEASKQECLKRERAQRARNDRHCQATMVQRSIPGSSEALAKILRYETTIDRQLYRAHGVGEASRCSAAPGQRSDSRRLAPCVG